jgi:hypothetical protein
MTTRSYILINILAFCAVLFVNYLSAALPLNGKTPGQLSDQYPNLFVPAGLTFSIWGIIYLWLMAWVAVQAVALFHEKTYANIAPGIEKIGFWFAVTCALNIAWLFAWHWEMIPLSVVVMVVLLAVLWRLFYRRDAVEWFHRRDAETRRRRVDFTAETQRRGGVESFRFL